MILACSSAGTDFGVPAKDGGSGVEIIASEAVRLAFLFVIMEVNGGRERAEALRHHIAQSERGAFVCLCFTGNSILMTTCRASTNQPSTRIS